MSACSHTTLELLPGKKKKVRCRHCHLTIESEELGEGCCPECFEVDGSRRYDFEELETAEKDNIRYRCEECGVIVES